VVWQSGAYEQPAAFRNNGLPGVTQMASSGRELIYHYAVKPMNRNIAGCGHDGYRAALDLAKHGVIVMAIVDLRENPTLTDLAQATRSQGITFSRMLCV